MPTASVRLRGPNGAFRTHAAIGTGPVHAVFKAIDEIVQAPAELLEYSINAVTEGIDALGHASVRVRTTSGDARVNPQHGAGSSHTFHGHAADTDILVASTKAYLSALNRVLAALGTMELSPGDDGAVESVPASSVNVSVA
jgi:2-isopropylmalate synthase